MRGRAFLLGVAIMSVVLGGQGADAEGVRYRDEVFDSVTTTRDIVYGQAIDEHGQLETLRLDLYEPAGDGEPLRPAFVWVHGGGLTEGDKGDGLSALIATGFAKRGYVAVSINYRLREGEYFDFDFDSGPEEPEFPQAMADAQHDAQAAVRWLRANAATYHVDGERIAISGVSAGAAIALYVNYNASDPGESGNPGYPSDTAACVDVAGAMDVSLMEAGEPPVLVVHGTVDERVPYSGALAIVARAREVGVTAEFDPIEGQGHAMWPEYLEQSIGWMSDFLYRHVASAAPGATVEPSDAGESAGRGPSAWLIAAAVMGAAGVALLLAAGVLYARRKRARATRG